jgi:hypothetical protein
VCRWRADAEISAGLRHGPGTWPNPCDFHLSSERESFEGTGEITNLARPLLFTDTDMGAALKKPYNETSASQIGTPIRNLPLSMTFKP